MDNSLLKSASDIDWGSQGFIMDEFVGYWDVPVHIMGPVEDMDKAAKLPESRITDEDETAIYYEWSTRQVEIEWLKFAGYLDRQASTQPNRG